ncbi:hypothetical protein HanRHA438_Chr13g0585561 [Helianthus annuus]|nr:hypothetical protein HanIR_Chr13g0625571 [Helianthus annuus]KAJ0857050.1 hypothetical protein HanRHA438_Chr13g0585561 [Helianthus annuus]
MPLTLTIRVTKQAKQTMDVNYSFHQLIPKYLFTLCSMFLYKDPAFSHMQDYSPKIIKDLTNINS